MRLIKISFLLLGLISGCAKDPDVLTLSNEPPGGNCANGGTRFQVGEQTPQYACNGVAGADGAQGNNGADGSKGEDGKDGRDGINGVNGQAGNDGKDGKDGAQGSTGATGPKGNDGLNGIDGQKGDKGNASFIDQEVFGPNEECKYGGIYVITGNDDDGNGTLDEDEKTVNALCHGTLPGPAPECSATIACPVGKTCSNGVCVNIPPTPECFDDQDCDDGDPMSGEVCNSAGVCQRWNLVCVPFAPCNDDNAGTTGDTCSASGMMCTGSPVVNPPAAASPCMTYIAAQPSNIKVGRVYPDNIGPDYISIEETDDVATQGEKYCAVNGAGVYGWPHPWNVWVVMTLPAREAWCTSHFACENSAGDEFAVEVNDQGTCHCPGNGTTPN